MRLNIKTIVSAFDISFIKPSALVTSTPDRAQCETASYRSSGKRHLPHMPSAIIKTAPCCCAL
jgi:hypothetical protein